MQYGLGIDLGTTQTAAAVRVDGRTEVVRLGGRRAEIPSLVFVGADGSLLIGEAAERRGQAEPARLAREFKRRIGDPVPILVGGAPFSAHALTAKLLRHVLDAVSRLRDGPPAVLTVTHPANWGPYKREQLDHALRLAETGPALLRTEPEAAALQHATARRIGPGETVAVYDLGGGTFDAAVLRREGEGFQLLGDTDGVEQLGGADFDEAVFGHVLGVLGSSVEGLDPNEPEVVTALARLRRDCVEAKEALSFDTEVMIPVALPGVHTRVRLNRSELESMIAPALADTVAAMHRALRAAQVAPADLDAVLLAGGSSRIPLIGELLSAAFDRPVVADPHPEHSIAMGAAIATALVTGAAAPFAAAVPAPAPTALAPAQVTRLLPGDDAASLVGGEAAQDSVTYSRGAASVPSRGAAVPAQTRTFPPALAAADGGRRPARRGRSLALVGAVVVAVIAGTVAVVALTRRDDERNAAVAPSAAAPAYPTDKMLIQVDTGGAQRPDRKSGAYLLTPGGTGRTAVADTGGDVLPEWSRDRKRVAVIRYRPDGGNAIWVMDPDGGNARKAVDDVNGGRVSWSADGRKLAFLRKVGDSPQVFAIELGKAKPAQLTRAPGMKDDPAWSPGGGAIAYWKSVGEQRQVFVLNADDPEEPGRQLTDGASGPGVDPNWSPDGLTIAYTHSTGGDASDIWLIGSDGGNPKQLTDDAAREMDPSWSPDGSWLAFARGTLEQPKIVITRADGAAERTLTEGGAREGHPCWS